MQNKIFLLLFQDRNTIVSAMSNQDFPIQLSVLASAN